MPVPEQAGSAAGHPDHLERRVVQGLPQRVADFEQVRAVRHPGRQRGQVPGQQPALDDRDQERQRQQAVDQALGQERAGRPLSDVGEQLRHRGDRGGGHGGQAGRDDRGDDQTVQPLGLDQPPDQQARYDQREHTIADVLQDREDVAQPLVGDDRGPPGGRRIAGGDGGRGDHDQAPGDQHPGGQQADVSRARPGTGRAAGSAAPRRRRRSGRSRRIPPSTPPMGRRSRRPRSPASETRRPGSAPRPPRAGRPPGSAAGR